jgi:hypothetical protein
MLEDEAMPCAGMTWGVCDEGAPSGCQSIPRRSPRGQAGNILRERELMSKGFYRECLVWGVIVWGEGWGWGDAHVSPSTTSANADGPGSSPERATGESCSWGVVFPTGP